MSSAIDARISDEIKAQVRAGWQKGIRQRDLAQQFGIGQGSVSKIVAGIPKPQPVPQVRRCVGCGTPIKYKTRCDACNQMWRRAWQQDYYLRRKQLDPLIDA